MGGGSSVTKRSDEEDAAGKKVHGPETLPETKNVREAAIERLESSVREEVGRGDPGRLALGVEVG